MAEKSFGVKEINLIGASGTPTIESPNNLNLNAVNVAISTNATIGGNLTVTGNIGIAGTLTYEDVTNIDSIGIVTARTGVKVLAGGINVVGASYFNNNIVATATTALSVTVADESSDTSCNVLFSTAATGNVAPKTGSNLTFNSSNGALSATTFSGSGASLTNLPAGNLTGTLPAISGANLTNLPAPTPADTDVQITFDIAGNSGSGYTFTGPGNDGSTGNPDIYLVRGQRYRFINTTGTGHPFAFRNAANNADYTDGITGSQSGTQDFNVQYDAPAQLKYRCTIHTGSMVGNIYITGQQLINGSNNRIVTASGAYGLNGESNLTFDGNNLAMSGTGVFTLTRNSRTLTLEGNYGNEGHPAIKTSSGHDLRIMTSGNNERLRIDSSGDVGLGTSIIENFGGGHVTLEVAGSTTSQGGVFKTATSDSAGTGSSGTEMIMFTDNTKGAINVVSSDPLTLSTANTERLRISSTGVMGLGNPNLRTNITVPHSTQPQTTTPRFQVENVVQSYSNAGISAINNSSSGYSPSITVGVSWADSLNSNSRGGAGNDYQLGSFNFVGNDGTNFITGAAINAYLDGTIGTNDMPARLTFLTTPDGSNTPLERLRITESGRVGIMEINPQSALQVKGGIRSAQTPGNGHIDLKHDGNNGSLISTYGSFLLYSQTGDFILHTTSSNTERLRITSSGHTLPGADNTYDLGSSAKRFRFIFTTDLQLSNENTGGNEVDGTEGNWTLQEGADDIYMINRKNGKRYKIKMEEV